MIAALTIPGGPVEAGLFIVMAAAAIYGALAVILASDPFISALSLILNFAALGTLYLMVGSPFVAIAQIIVYAGAVVVLFLFVMAYLGDRREIFSNTTRYRNLPRASGVIAALVGGLMVAAILRASLPKVPALDAVTDTEFEYGSAQAVGDLFLTRYTLAFEATSVILLVAAVGGILLGLTGRARHRKLRELMGTRSADQQRRLSVPRGEAEATNRPSSDEGSPS